MGAEDMAATKTRAFPGFEYSGFTYRVVNDAGKLVDLRGKERTIDWPRIREAAKENAGEDIFGDEKPEALLKKDIEAASAFWTKFAKKGSKKAYQKYAEMFKRIACRALDQREPDKTG